MRRLTKLLCGFILVFSCCLFLGNLSIVFAALENPDTSDIIAGDGTQHSNWSFRGDDLDYTLRIALVELRQSTAASKTTPLKDANQLWILNGSSIDFLFGNKVNVFADNVAWGFSKEGYDKVKSDLAHASEGVWLWNDGNFVDVSTHLVSYNTIVNAVNTYNSNQGIAERAISFDTGLFSNMSVLESPFRSLSEAVHDVGAMEAIIDVFKASGIAVPSSMTGSNTCLVIEPVTMFSPDSTSGLAKGLCYKCFTYRAACWYENTKDGIYSSKGIATDYAVNWRHHSPHNNKPADTNPICTAEYDGETNCTSGARSHSALPGHLWQDTILGISTNATELSKVAGCFIICRNLEQPEETVAAAINITYDGEEPDSDKRFEVYSETSKKSAAEYTRWEADDWKEANTAEQRIAATEDKLADFVLKKALAYDFNVKNKNVATVMSLDATVEEFMDDVHKSKLSIKWKQDDLQSHDKNFGQILNIQTIKYDGDTGGNAIRDAILKEMANSDAANLESTRWIDLFTTEDYIDDWSDAHAELAGKLLESTRQRYAKPSIGENNEFLPKSHFAVNINVWAKPVPVESHVIEISVKCYPDDSTKDPDVADTRDDLEYTNMTEEEYLPSSDVVTLLVYNNEDINAPDDILSHIQTIKDSFVGKHTIDEVIAAFKSSAPDNRIYTSDSPKTIGLGSNPNDNVVDKGYTVIVLRVEEERIIITPPPAVGNGQVELPDYELNKIYPNIVDNSNAGTNYVTHLNTDTWSYWDKAGKYRWVECTRHAGSAHKEKWWDATCGSHRDYNIKLTDNFSGNVTTYDDSISVAKAWVLNTSYDKWYTRSVLRIGKVLDIDCQGSGHLVTYDLDLIREVSGDTRTLASMSKIDSDWKTFVTQVLKLTVANKPSKTVMPSAYRNSNANISGVFKDTLLWKAVFNETGGTQGYSSKLQYFATNKPADHFCGGCRCYGHAGTYSTYYCSGCYCPGYNHSGTYHILQADRESWAYLVNGNRQTEFQVDISEVFYKYRTDKKDIGLNKENVDDVVFVKNPAQQGAATPVSSTAKLDAKDIFKYIYNKNHDGVTGGDTTKVVLNYYPEVEMRAHKHTGESVNSVNDYISSQIAKPMEGGRFEIMTIGEEMRQSYSSSMYIFRLKKAAIGNDVNGKLWSDGTATGEAANKISNGLPVIYAGSDVTLTADTTFDVLMFGYSLDVIKSGDALRGTTYNTVIADNSSVYNTWGNSTSQQNLKKAFKTWAEDMTDVKRWAADVELDVSGLMGYVPKQYNNFSASVGKIAQVSDGISKVSVDEKDVYQLEIRKGKVVEDNESFKRFLEQLRKDYDLDTVDEAKDVFYKSGLHTAILNAIEHVDSPENTSQADPEGNLGANGHWYDEQVKTIVIRRYEATPMRMSNIVLQDKVDFGAAPDADDRSSNKNGNMTKAVTGQWFLTLHLQDLPKWMVENGNKEYVAANRNSTVADSIETVTTIIDKIYINGCDFRIPNGQTTEMD